MAPLLIAAVDQTLRACGRVPTYALIANAPSIISEDVARIATRLAQIAAQ
jgi:hypothetical protein